MSISRTWTRISSKDVVYAMNENDREREQLELFHTWMSECAETGYRESLSNQLTELIGQWAERGRNELMLRAVELVETRIRSKESTWNQITFMLNRLETIMAYTSAAPDTLACLYRLMTERRGADSPYPRNPRVYDLRYYVAAMAASHTREELLPIMAYAADDPDTPLEPLALLLYEAAFRGKTSGHEPAVRRAHDLVKRSGHALAWLPLGLTELERELSPRLFSRDGGGGYGSPFGPKRRAGKAECRAIREEAHGRAPTIAICPAIHTADELERLEAATRNWKMLSNGEVESAIFDLEGVFQPEHVTAELLLSLGLSCLHGANAGQVLLRPMPPSVALSFLYAAAANGGAYNEGDQSAYGRLEAWRTLGVLTGLSGEADAIDVQQAAESCSWRYFEAPTPWFRQVAWDFGIAALRPDGRTLAVLAATDTD